MSYQIVTSFKLVLLPFFPEDYRKCYLRESVWRGVFLKALLRKHSVEAIKRYVSCEIEVFLSETSSQAACDTSTACATVPRVQFFGSRNNYYAVRSIVRPGCVL